jgi:dTDP-4-dehydrorhamnose reductase
VILIFGGGGQLGTELARAAKLKAIPYAAFRHAEVDISDAEAVSQALNDKRPNLVVNAAAFTRVDLAETEIEAARVVNEVGPGVIASACAARQTPLIHISTDYVFDGSKPGAYVESDPIAPLGVYGRTKADGEEAVRRAWPRHVILRTSWVYGEFGSNFLKTMLQLAKDRDELRVVADQTGCPTSTREIAHAILRIAPRLSVESACGTYHFAGNGWTSWYGFASRIIAAQAEETGRRPKLIAIATKDYPTAARRPANSTFDCSHFESVFGFRANDWAQETDAIVKLLIGQG